MTDKTMINIGHTNKVKYKENNTFVLHKTKNGFNHLFNYKVLADLDFVPKLISEDDDKLVWEWIEGEHLTNPTDEDLAQLGIMMRKLHKSNVMLPKNILRRRVNHYLKVIHEKKLHIPEIENNYRPMIKLLGRMGKLNPCHNDLWDQNILKDKNGKLWFVDWEYASMGDKHFDLEFLLSYYQLPSTKEQILLTAYDSLDDYHAYIEEWRPGYRKLVNWITLCWAYAQDQLPFPMEGIKKTLAGR